MSLWRLLVLPHHSTAAQVSQYRGMIEIQLATHLLEMLFFIKSSASKNVDGLRDDSKKGPVLIPPGEI